MTKMVEIEHKDGRRYAVTLAKFHKIYEPQGFKALRYEDGSPLPEPKPKKDGE